MTTITIDIPDSKASALSAYAAKMGGRVVDKTKKIKTSLPQNAEQEDDDEVTHEHFFGENLRRVINAFKK